MQTDTIFLTTTLHMYFERSCLYISLGNLFVGIVMGWNFTTVVSWFSRY